MASKSQLNFLPEDYVERHRQQRTNVICLSLFAVVMAGLIVAFLLDERRQATASQARDGVGKRMESAGQQLAQIEEMQSRKETMMRKADVTAALLERRPRHFLLAFITNALPKGSSLLSIELTTKEVRNSSTKVSDAQKRGITAAPTGRVSRASRTAQAGADKTGQDSVTRTETIRVIGLAPNDKVVSQFIAALDNSALFRRVDLERSEEHAYQQQAVRRFILRVELNDQAEVTDDMVQSQQLRSGAFESN